ncbi:MAG: TadE family protein [Paracoccaceae bacterium]
MRMSKWFKSFRKDQDGSSTIEFVLLFPTFMAIFFLGFESGYYMLRGVMLERGVDVAVRDVRIGGGNIPDLATIKTDICDVALILGSDNECEDSLQVVIRPVAPVPGGVADLGTDIDCIDKTVDINDAANDTIYDTGSGNQLMLVVVCSLEIPMFPTTGIGAGMRYDTQGNLALVSTAMFVNEPGNTIDRETVAITGGSGT